MVSTHSRPKAAGITISFVLVTKTFQHTAARRRLNRKTRNRRRDWSFNTQPPEGGWTYTAGMSGSGGVSTHSRPKAAVRSRSIGFWKMRFQHTAARRRLTADKPGKTVNRLVSTHSRPKAAATAAQAVIPTSLFQHTAARRRLTKQSKLLIYGTSFNTQPPEGGCNGLIFSKASCNVSTHSRPKAADVLLQISKSRLMFQHTAARRRLTFCCKYQRAD